ncbi:hypothetical protein Mmc1_0717 [Magnetococcus marinus MC-1]|uniref:Uncharacterized protein TP-0789 domain-containing protein n=1 Tax=Magnetococcus marinus (strain ATCC BAA-1437 / JCM 17883 / MC-1) TaxID=156889 RepID=A0L5J5_MAGMM|nr:outer membrane lipoprotein-sorting protein [Magnetococcus marinus]ABK43238.1 hypothetical protein Mmc1_0717 [Magnetococcus marinus MC-1]
MKKRFGVEGLWLALMMFVVPAFAEPTAEERLREVVGMLQPSPCEYYWNIDTTRTHETKKGVFTVAYMAKLSADQWAVLIAAPDMLKGRALLRQGAHYWTRNPGELQNREMRPNQTFLGGILTNKDLFPLILEQSHAEVVSDERQARKEEKQKALSEYDKIVQNERFGIMLETGHLRIKDRSGDGVLAVGEAPPQLVMRLTPRQGDKVDGYNYAMLSVDADSNRPRWLKLFGAGERQLKYFVYNDFKRMSDGRPHPGRVEIFNGLNSTFKSEMLLGTLQCGPLPEDAFQPNRLSQFGKLLLR